MLLILIQHKKVSLTILTVEIFVIRLKKLELVFGYTETSVKEPMVDGETDVKVEIIEYDATFSVTVPLVNASLNLRAMRHKRLRNDVYTFANDPLNNK